MSPYNLNETESLLVCVACGTQFPTSDRNTLKTCLICDDPRQYIPPPQQSFTTLADIRSKHKNTFTPFPNNPSLISISTTPKLAIGQRAILVKTPAGNILWDCLTLVDEDTVSEIKENHGGLHGIVISHPHYYSTHVEWADAFNCPVYLAVEDKQWVVRTSEKQVFLDGGKTETPIEIGGVDTGIKVIKLGGHFPGSLTLLYSSNLLIADTLMTTPSAISNFSVNALSEPRTRPKGVNTYAFMWSIPNYIPLSANEIIRMWGILKEYDFAATYGAFEWQNVEGDDVKGRVLQSMQIQTRYMGYGEHPFLHTLF
ncbi:metallo-beta-lactamase family protein [Immersiella caudata]|uniref:Metallo-beta-lactamase family protein n=1 Tax=Immersiella caudata TaxID=314043 RepID=A0AA39XEK3_9PEZI|nr:metallo-beta-lactamase family protein [Immersiella caudata]